MGKVGKMLETTMFSSLSKDRNAHLSHVQGCACLTHYQMTNFGLFQIERLCRRQFEM